MESINYMQRAGANEVITKSQRPSLIRGIEAVMAVIMLLAFLFILHGCKEDDDMDNQKPDSFNGTITAKVENGASYDNQISAVWALFDSSTSTGQLTGRSLASGEYSNGGFTFNMPEIPAQFLMNVQTFFAAVLNVSGELEISNPDARMHYADFWGIDDSNNYVDYFTYTNTGSKRTTCLFVYADSDVTVKGGTNINVMIVQGWNRIYRSSEKVVSKAPGGMKWYLRSVVK